MPLHFTRVPDIRPKASSLNRSQEFSLVGVVLKKKRFLGTLMLYRGWLRGRLVLPPLQ